MAYLDFSKPIIVKKINKCDILELAAKLAEENGVLDVSNILNGTVQLRYVGRVPWKKGDVKFKKIDDMYYHYGRGLIQIGELRVASDNFPAYSAVIDALGTPGSMNYWEQNKELYESVYDKVHKEASISQRAHTDRSTFPMPSIAW
jgi:hypothetical protein